MVLDASGAVVASRRGGHDGSFVDRDYFRFHRARANDTPFVGRSAPQRDSGRWSVPVTRRISGNDGSFAGVVVVEVDPAQFLKFHQHREIGRDGVLDVVALDGVSRVRLTGDVVSHGEDLADGELGLAQANAASGALETDFAGGGLVRYVVWRHLVGWPLLVAAGLSRDELLAAMAPEESVYIKWAVAATAIVWLFALLLLVVLARHQRGLVELTRSEARLNVMFEQAAIGIMQTTLDGRIVQVNDKLCEMLGYGTDELLKRTYRNLAHPDELTAALEQRTQLVTGRLGHVSAEQRFRRSDGGEIWASLTTSLVPEADGSPAYFVHMLEGIDERKRLQRDIERLVQHDGLTQLPNRGLFYHRLQQALAQARRRNWITGVLSVDLDRFKTINDTLGHAVGDELLQHVAQRLKASVRAEDTVARMGGDEFAIVLAEVSGEAGAAKVAGKIIHALAKPYHLAKHEVFTTVSIGIALCEAGAGDADALISGAGAAMYDAKKAGRNRYAFYAATMSERAMEKSLLEKELRNALKRDEFELHYQPKVDLRSGELAGFEALLRWQRENGERVSPASFIPVLEETGLIEEVGEWVLRAACAQLAAWHAAGIAAVPVAGNLSPRQFQSDDIAGVIQRAMRDHTVDPALLDLGITESTAMNDAEAAIAALGRLKALGVRIAIDDFGTGYSSLSYLKRFPIDALKIDRSFVIDLPDSEEGASIARAVITMAQALRLKVVAEGVETAAQCEFLTANGCDQLQGYYCARPLPAEQATELLRGRRRMLPRPQLVAAGGRGLAAA